MLIRRRKNRFDPAGLLRSALCRAFNLAERSDDRFKRLLDAAPDAMVIVDHRARIVMINAQAATMFGYSSDELFGQGVDVLVPERYRNAHSHHHDEYFASPRTRPMGTSMEAYARRKDGTDFPAEISLSPIDTTDGTLVLSAIRDVTERKRIQDQLQETSRLKSEFLANMSHELRTPLNAIVGFTEMLFHGKAGPLAPEHREFVGEILASSKHLVQLVNDVLDLSKLEAGRVVLHPREVDLTELVAGVCEALRGAWAGKRLQIDVHVESDVGSVVVDPDRMEQIVHNYLSNAIKFTADGGRITIRIGPEGAHLFRLDVVDTGIGISAEDQARLFMPFHQLDGGASKHYQGTGIGLSLTRRLVEAHGGRVEVHSQPHVGSTFSAILPRMTPGANEQRLTSDDIRARVAGHSHSARD